MTTPSVLVLGSGELGGEVLKSLARQSLRGNIKVDVLKRPKTTGDGKALALADGTSFESLSIGIAHGDVTQDPIEQLASIFRKYHTVINCTGMQLAPETQLKIAETAIKAGVKRYFPWQFGAWQKASSQQSLYSVLTESLGIDYDAIGRSSPQPLFDKQLDVRDRLRSQSATSWVILSTGLFTSFLFEPVFGVVDAARTSVTALGSWKNRVTVTTPEDIGRITADICLAHPEISGVVYGASDTVSMEQVADVLDSLFARKVTRSLKTIDQILDELAATPDSEILRYQAVFARGIGVSWDKAFTFNESHDLPTQTAAEWAREHLR